MNCQRPVFKTLYESLIRPCLEYCCIAWDPYRANQIKLLERIQKRYVRMMCRDWQSSYNVILEQLNMPNLEARRTYHRLVMFYKITRNLVNVNLIIKPANRIGRNDHERKVTIPFAKTDYYKNSFYVRTSKDWNMLPRNVINSTSISTFKTLLKTHLHI